MELYMDECTIQTENSRKENKDKKGNDSKYYIIANDEKVVAKVNENWIAYEIMNRLKDQFDDIKVCEIL